MIRKQVVRIAALVATMAMAVAATGCANGPKQRIAMLEDANRNLTERLNAAQRQLDAADRERADCANLLALARNEANMLRSQLAEKPVMEEPAPGWTAVPGGAMIAIEGSILFAPGKVTLRNEARRTLDGIVSTVRGEYADKDVMIFGHTDNTPIKKSGWADNYQLSTERALAVVRYLRDQGVSTARLVACGCGEHRPRVPNSSEVNRSTNRRVEVFAIDPQLTSNQP